MDKHSVSPFCPRYHYAVELIGRRWTGAIVRMLLVEPRRFAELAASIPDLSDRMLAERLRELEQARIVARTVVPETPVRVEYALTPMGRALEPSIRALGQWAETWLPADIGQPRASLSRSSPVKGQPEKRRGASSETSAASTVGRARPRSTRSRPSSNSDRGGARR